MRTFALLGFFLLGVAAIVEGAVIVRLSGRRAGLTKRGLAANPSGRGGIGALTERPRREGEVALARPVATLPRLLPASESPTAAAPAVAVLSEALASSEGREQLKAALDI